MYSPSKAPTAGVKFRLALKFHAIFILLVVTIGTSKKLSLIRVDQISLLVSVDILKTFKGLILSSDC